MKDNHGALCYNINVQRLSLSFAYWSKRFTYVFYPTYVHTSYIDVQIFFPLNIIKSIRWYLK